MPVQASGFLILAMTEVISSIVSNRKEAVMNGPKNRSMHRCTQKVFDVDRRLIKKILLVIGITTILEASLLPPALGHPFPLLTVV